MSEREYKEQEMHEIIGNIDAHIACLISAARMAGADPGSESAKERVEEFRGYLKEEIDREVTTSMSEFQPPDNDVFEGMEPGDILNFKIDRIRDELPQPMQADFDVVMDMLQQAAYAEGRKDEREAPRETLDECGAGDTIAYKFQAPNGSYWYIRADDHKTIAYWRDKRKLIPLTDGKARIAAETGAVSEVDGGGA